MNKSQSVPVKLCDVDVNPMRKSSSVSDLDETSSEFTYEEFFEGDALGSSSDYNSIKDSVDQRRKGNK